MNYVFVHCALESALWQRLSAIKVELELELVENETDWCARCREVVNTILVVICY